jgi:hypothetical protein
MLFVIYKKKKSLSTVESGESKLKNKRNTVNIVLILNWLAFRCGHIWGHVKIHGMDGLKRCIKADLVSGWRTQPHDILFSISGC